MSRESDIKALKKLKNDMAEADAFAELANEEWEVARKIKEEMDNTKFVFNPLPTDNYETKKAEFVDTWKNFFKNTAKFKGVFLGLYSIAMIVFAIIIFIAAFKNDGTSVLSAQHNWTDTPSRVLTAVAMAAFPVIAAIFPWVHIVNKDFIWSFIKVSLIALGISGVLFAVICDAVNSIHLLPIVLGAMVAIFVFCFIVQFICFIISKLPIFSAKQKAILADEKQKDIDNAELNKVNEPKEKAEWEAWWAGYKPELREKGLHHISLGDTAMEKAKAHLEAANESTVLGENEKSIEVIDLLISFIESRRADSIKEALHEYDKMEQNKKLLEIEAIKASIEIEKAKKENADRQYEMEMNRRHQIEMEAQARRSADMQSQIAANTAAAAASAEGMRKDAAAAAAEAAEAQTRIGNNVAAIYRNEYYNS